MTEASFQDAVVQLCKMLGVYSFHPYFSRRSASGWPDLAMVGDNGFMTRELKTERGRLTGDQKRWGSMLRQAGVNWDVWRPSDLQSGRIQRELREIA